jgi:phage replication O-like protein O
VLIFAVALFHAAIRAIPEPSCLVHCTFQCARLANMLLEEYAGADLTKRQFKVLLAVLRLTYGWNKKMDRISDSQIASIAKLPVKRCNEAKLQLVSMNILIQHGRQFGPNKNVSEWRIPQNEGESLKSGDKKSLKLGDSNPSKQGDTKDIIPKTVKTDPPKSPRGESVKFDPYSIPVPEWLNQQAWYEWIEYRKETKKPIKTEKTVTKAFGVLKECLDNGHDPVDVINRSIANGYQGLFKPNYPAPKQIPVQQEIQQRSEEHWNSRKSWEEKFI